MNDLLEMLEQTKQKSNMLAEDVLRCFKLAVHMNRPDGLSLGDKALIAVFSDCLEMARKLESKLANL